MLYSELHCGLNLFAPMYSKAQSPFTTKNRNRLYKQQQQSQDLNISVDFSIINYESFLFPLLNSGLVTRHDEAELLLPPTVISFL